jgi:hypothetical protein
MEGVFFTSMSGENFIYSIKYLVGKGSKPPRLGRGLGVRPVKRN